ncbi:MAG: carboxypeptidase regulatory-like domain-containing protein [Acidobacteria bacterium]|nr:carboxypeptidase regulatory-like domain-containing protein [Acidobacteriota bacterium]
MFKINSVRVTSLAILFAFMVTGVGSLALAQSAVTGAVGGAATDQNNAVVANASVTLKSLDTNKTETATTDSDGRFRFNNLQPGTYTITISAPGFSEYKRDQVVVEVGRLSNIDAVLGVGAATAAVDIVATASAVNIDSKEFTTNINQTAINDLPINGRRWSNFVILTPGSVPDGSFGLISFRGVSGLLNNNTVDGGDNNQAFFGEERGRTRISYSISQSAIREFQVNTSNYSAEYGRAAGGVTNAVTKSGTNDLHGDAFYFQRNNEWGARNPRAFQSVLVNGVSTTVGIKPEDVRHQFGGTLGGPIAKDKLFFFFSYDQQKRNFPGLGIFTDPNYLNGVNRTALIGKGLTNAQIDDTVSFLNSLTGTVPRRGDQRLLLPKIDWQINTSNSFSINYNRLRWNSPAGIQTQATNTRGRASFGDDFVKVDWGTARLVSTIKPSLVNEFRVQYARDFEFQISQTPAPGEPRTALNGSSPDVRLQNGLNFGKPNFLERSSYPKEKRTQFTDNVTATLGGNTLRFGVDINHVRDVLNNLFQESGSFFYNSLNDFIVDYVNWKTPLPATTTCVGSARARGKCYSGNFAQGFGPIGAEFSTTDYNFYGQYDWKFAPRVTFNLGLRYEYQKFPDAKLPNPSTATIPNTGVTFNQATSQLPDDKNNFGPRFGFAIGVTDDGKTSLRGGYGLYYGRTINSTIYNAFSNTGAAGGQFQVSLQPTNAAAPVFPNVLTSAPAGAGAIQYFSPNFGNSMIHQMDLIFEREILRNTTFSASYLFSLGQKLPTFLDRNLNVPVDNQTFTVSGGPFNGQSFTIPVFRGARPNTSFSQLTEIASAVKSEYNAMVLQVNRRFSGGLQFLASYTLSKAVDDSQTSQTFTTANVPFNVFDPKAERGRSRFDRRNKFVISAVYAPRLKSDSKFATALIDGWSIAPIFQFYTGFPYDGLVSGSLGGTTAGSLNGAGSSSNRIPLAVRNAFTAPGVKNFDLRLSRRFYIKENMSFEFLGEAFNIFNRTQFTGVNATMYTLSGTTLNFNPVFGTITEAGGTLYRERQVQIGLRFQF